ncbi:MULTISPECIES: phosphopantetheine-binding protein [Thermomonosporaceae]|uniref:phosphopantetheine-binding protein n=1 Tax=Thermomonosporaceae TaxID=2012 RepID=UPI00255A767E|nr:MULTISPECIES: phosphopantetheine-binding protein [Thermomonosporaceae]MDL4774232.1 phosphopantetheine-binding protein [Actinomadura xylanilytica]
MSTTDTVLGEVVEMLIEIVGEDFLLDVEITRDTTFSDDLALESIEFVALTEKLQRRYSGRVDFAALVADMDITEIMAMKVGTLVAYVEERTTVARPGSRAR